MAQAAESTIADVISRSEREILSEWVNHQLTAVTMRRELLKDDEVREQSRRFLTLFSETLRNAKAGQDIQSEAWGSRPRCCARRRPRAPDVAVLHVSRSILTKDAFVPSYRRAFAAARKMMGNRRRFSTCVLRSC